MDRGEAKEYEYEELYRVRHINETSPEGRLLHAVFQTTFEDFYRRDSIEWWIAVGWVWGMEFGDTPIFSFEQCCAGLRLDGRSFDIDFWREKMMMFAQWVFYAGKPTRLIERTSWKTKRAQVIRQRVNSFAGYRRYAS